jgi:hypothetical protein
MASRQVNRSMSGMAKELVEQYLAKEESRKAKERRPR